MKDYWLNWALMAPISNRFVALNVTEVYSDSNGSVTANLLDTRSSDLACLNSALDDHQTKEILDGSGDSVIGAIPVYRKQESFMT